MHYSAGKIADQYREQAALEWQVEWLDMANLTLGQVCQKGRLSLTKCSDRGTGPSLAVSLAKTKSSRTIAVRHCSVQKLHSSAIALLQIFIAGSRVATVFNL